jgi:site-specific DNA-methyltransferase (adenine-specific)
MNLYYSDKWVRIYQGDYQELAPSLAAKVDLILTDPPYGVTHNKADICVDLYDLLTRYPAVVFSQQPYTTDVINGNRRQFKYELIWDKVLTSGFLNANRAPLRRHENILIFGSVKYNPQKTVGDKNHSKGKSKTNQNNNYGDYGFIDNTDSLGELKHPHSIVTFPKPHPSVALHRTEKPTALIEWLIKTYSDENDVIFDPFLGSGTTAYCAKKLNRRCLGIEIDESFCEIAAKRCNQEVMVLNV